MSAPPRVRALLLGAPDGPVPVIHRGADAVYVDVAGRCVGVVGRRATPVPCALRSRSDDLRLDSGDVPGRAAYLREGVLHLDGTPLGIGRFVDVRVPSLQDPTDPVAAQAIPSAAVAEFVGLIGAGLGPGSVADVVGRGDGLTPLGDDIVCGWLALHRAAGLPTPDVDAAVRACLGRTTLLSATLLDCALHGEVIPEFAAYVASLGSADPATVANRAARLSAVGHTSGSGMLYGARLALSALHPTGAPA